MNAHENRIPARRELGGMLITPLLLAAFSLACTGLHASAQEAAVRHDAAHIERPPTLTVGGQGEVAAPPDRATVRLGAEAQAADAAAAQSTVNATMQKALAEIQRVGIPERAIQTTGLNLSPVYAPREPGQEAELPRVIAYRASNSIQVQVDDLARVGKVIDAGVAAGANRLQGVSFELQNDLPQRTRALTLAAQEAKTKAQTIAAALQVELGQVREITEGGVSVIPRQENFAASRMMAMDAAPTPVQPGEVRVQASVTVRYEIAPAKPTAK